MRDIALCCDSVKRDCPKAATCYRALAEPCEWGQEWFIPHHPGQDCEDYIHEEPMDKSFRNEEKE